MRFSILWSAANIKVSRSIGLIIHEGQLTYQRQNLHLMWTWANGGIRTELTVAARRQWPSQGSRTGSRPRCESAPSEASSMARSPSSRPWNTPILREPVSIRRSPTILGMYVNRLDHRLRSRGRKAVEVLSRRGFRAGVIPKLVVPEFVDESI